MSAVQDGVSIGSSSCKFGFHTRNIKEIIFKFESYQQDRVSNNQNKPIENIRYQDKPIIFYCFKFTVIHKMNSVTGKYMTSIVETLKEKYFLR